MKKNILLILFLFVFGIVKAQIPPIIYISGDGSGDYNCDGSSDQVEINQALDFVAADTNYTTVYLKGSNIYWINEPIYISANTILEGDADVVIKLIDNAGWDTRFKPLIGQKGHVLRIGLEDTTITTGNITIRGFEIDGNRQNQTEPSGNSYYNMICLQNCYNTTINDMYMHDNLSDVLNTGYDVSGFDINLRFYNNRVHGSGHDGIFVIHSENIEIYDNNFTNNRTDAHIRLQYCNHFKIYNNIAGNDPDNRNSGGIGIDIQVKGTIPLNDAEIYGNFIYGKGAFHGIWLWQLKKGGELNTHRDVHIHHNVIVGNQASGIGIFGFNNTLIENNV
ncbi:MAG: right-handed parallel beta-helix repeat-containing protein, partial [Candidatus Marinimicrobia bacterium]|nr:right-handed parallel beta-helix repeat-containing protein [Candidatus Neomarinimicrobiota bacterium]